MKKRCSEKTVYLLAALAASAILAVRLLDTSYDVAAVPRVFWWMIGLALIPGTLKETFTSRYLLPALLGSAVLALISISLKGLPVYLHAYTRDAISAMTNGVLRRLTVFVTGFALLKEALASFDILRAGIPSELDGRRMRGGAGARQVWLSTSLFTFAALCVLWLVRYYPSGTSPDTWNQWYQIHGEIPLGDLHTPFHTLLMALLMKLWDSYAIVILFQILCVSLVSGLLYAGLYKRGVAPSFIMLCCVAFSTAGWCDIYMYPWKDTLYAVMLAMLLYLILWANGHDYRMPVWRAALTGAVLALIYLLRYNGVVCLLAAGTLFIIMLLRRGLFKQTAAFLLTAVFLIAGAQALFYNALGFKRQANGFALQVFGAGIAAVVAENGNVTEAELQKIDDLLGVDWIRDHYTPWNATGLIWAAETNDPEGYFQQGDTYALNNFFVVGLGEHKAEIIRLYLSLLVKNPLLMLREVLYSTWLIWGNTGAFSNAEMLLLVVLAAIYTLRRNARRAYILAALLPLAANVASIAVSTITNETRYMLPTFLLFAPLTLYLVSESAAQEKKQG